MAAADSCDPLSPPAGPTVTVSSVAELVDAVNSAAPGLTILVADGVYNLDGAYLRIAAPGVSLRGAGGDRSAVVLDGNYQTTEIVQVVASDVTIADLTLREAYYHPIHVMSTDGADSLHTLIYNVHILDPGEQAIKINPGAAGYYPDEGVIACSHIELTGDGRGQIRNNCYTGGVDAHQVQGWVIRDNLIEGFWCPSGLSEHAIHLWRGSRDTLVERNLLLNNARGVGFGLSTSGDGRTYGDSVCPEASGYVDHYTGLIRNNMVFASDSNLFASEYGFDCGICLWNACEAEVLHNTVFSTQAPFSSIEWRFPNTTVLLANNLANYPMLPRDGAVATQLNNRSDAQAGWFVDAAAGDLHLRYSAAQAIDQGAYLGTLTDDFDGDPRPHGAGPDIGADEFLPALRLQAAPGDQALYLSWTLSGALPDGAEWQIVYQGPSGDQPSPVGGIDPTARAYTLTGLQNYAEYTVTLNAIQEGATILSATAAATPSDLFIHLPLITSD